MFKTGSNEYLDKVKHTIEARKAPLSWWPQINSSFRADSTDDTAWWYVQLIGCGFHLGTSLTLYKALAMVRMWDTTGVKQYLDIAVVDEVYIYR